ncbi:uncharacterized protein [Aquarana catesbeiana]|uniref:uncharacterized protein isoform X2 n=1 Tax=Aquarana catesbeiana TaxID=8400 RepID=UPI003CC9E0EF
MSNLGLTSAHCLIIPEASATVLLFYDCREAVIKKMKKCLRGEHIRGKPVEFQEREAKLRDGLDLLVEDVPGVSIKGPHERAGDQATSSVERSAPCPSHRHSESPICNGLSSSINF